MKTKIKSLILVLIMLISAGVTGYTLMNTKSALPPGNMSAQDEFPSDIQNNENGFSQPPENNEEKFSDSKDEKSFEPGGMNGNEIGKSDGNSNFGMIGFRNQLTTAQFIIVGVCSGIFSLALLFLLMGIKDKLFYKNKYKLITYILSFIILTTYLTAGIIFAANTFAFDKGNHTDESAQKESVTLDENNVVNSHVIDLTSQDTDVTITNGGSYEFSGEFSHSIIVDAQDEEVEIVLNNAKITNDKTAAIIGLSAKNITVNMKDGTENQLSDGGNSEYDGCIFSNAELIFTGEGELIVNGNQNEGEGIATETADITINSGKFVITSNDDGINAGGDGAEITINGGEIYVNASGDGIDSNKNAVINGGTLFVIGSDVGGDAGIDTDAGYTINGGVVVALGSDMIETPLDTSKQKSIALTLDEKINKDTLVTLMTGDERIVTFNAPKSFKTVIISSNLLADGDYTLYYEDSNSVSDYGLCDDSVFAKENIVTIHNQEVFNITKTVNTFPEK